MTPFEKGYKAFLDGVPKDGNPFGEAEPWSSGKWLAGWQRAAIDRREKS